MKAIKILKAALRTLAAIPCALVLWVVYFTVGMVSLNKRRVANCVESRSTERLSRNCYRCFGLNINALHNGL